MRKKLIVANWKSNKNPSEAKDWLDEFKLKLEFTKLNNDNIEVVICPPYIDLPVLKDTLKILSFPFSVSLGSQDVSHFPDGSYTGCVSVNQIKDFVSYSLVGHSERKKYFNEQIENIETKIDFLLPFGIKPIVCAGSEQDLPGNIKKYNPQQIAIMFEPPSAISKNGVFEAVDPAKVEETISSWQNKYGPYQFLYGGSVNSENAKSLLLAGAEGFVSGKASLNVDSFIEILQNV